MRVKIINGPFKDRLGYVVLETIGVQRRLCGGQIAVDSVTVLIDKMLLPIEFKPNQLTLPQ